MVKWFLRHSNTISTCRISYTSDVLSMNHDRAELLQGIKTCTFSGMGALAFLAWDICITMGDEIRQIWSRPWTFLKVLYFFLRYYSLALLLFEQILALKFETGLVFSDRSCYIWLGFQAVSTELLQVAVQILLILRLYALYSSLLLRRLLAFLFCAEVVTMIVVFCFRFNQVKFGEQCAVIHMPVVAIVFFAWPPMFETILFGLTMTKFYVALRDGWGRQSVLGRFFQDGIWVFALPFVSSTVNACCMLLLPGSVSSVAFIWVIAVAGFAGYRLVLNMSHLLQARSPPETIAYPDTVLEVFDEETRHRNYESFLSTKGDTSTMTGFSDLPSSCLPTL